MQDASNETTTESTSVDVSETVQEAADAVASMDPNRIMEFLQNNGLDSSAFVALGKNIIIALLIYYIGRFIGNLVTSLLEGFGFDSILDTLGLPDIGGSSSSTSTTSPTTDFSTPSSTTIQPPMPGGSTLIQPPSDSSRSQTPSEIVGVIIQVGVVLFGIVWRWLFLFQYSQLGLVCSD